MHGESSGENAYRSRQISSGDAQRTKGSGFRILPNGFSPFILLSFGNKKRSLFPARKWKWKRYGIHLPLIIDAVFAVSPNVSGSRKGSGL